MALSDWLFYFYSAVLIGSATAVVTARNQVYSALFLVLTFFTASALWVLLQVEFLAIALIVVYIGAVMVLFLFVVMMLDGHIQAVRRRFSAYVPAALAVLALLALEVLGLFANQRFAPTHTPVPPDRPADYSNIHELGLRLFTEYLFQFEVAGVILLIAVVAALVLTHRPKRDPKRIDPARQIAAQAQGRVRLVSMPAEADPDQQEEQS